MHFLKKNINSIFISTLLLYMFLAVINKHTQLALFSIAIEVIAILVVVKKEWIIRNFWHYF